MVKGIHKSTETKFDSICYIVYVEHVYEVPKLEWLNQQMLSCCLQIQYRSCFPMYPVDDTFIVVQRYVSRYIRLILCLQELR